MSEELREERQVKTVNTHEQTSYEETSYEPWVQLAAAIVNRAVQDYRLLYRRYLRYPEDPDLKAAVQYERKFFYGEWFEMLSDYNGPQLLRSLEKMVKAEHEEKQRKAMEKALAKRDSEIRAEIEARGAAEKKGGGA